MAHEINNPLSGILQSVQVLQRRLVDDSSNNTKTATDSGCSFDSILRYTKARGVPVILEGIRESGVRAARIVRTMLDFSRKSELSNVPACLNDLLDKAIELCSTDYDLSKKFDFRSIRIIKDYDLSLPDVPCSVTQIQQVFVNLLGNAAHALSDSSDPTITLCTKIFNNNVLVEIIDNGRGMNDETRRRVFEPFFTTKPVGEGTGLGLSVSYFIITNNHHGSIDVESYPGKGTKFSISLQILH
jgi:polar amino acid transport system substrate-binding protein